MNKPNVAATNNFLNWEFQLMGKIVWNEIKKNIETKNPKMMKFMAKYYSSDAKEEGYVLIISRAKT